MTLEEMTFRIRGSAFNVHNKLGPGLLESIYEGALAHELRKAGLTVAQQIIVPVVYEGIKFDQAFRLDLLINEMIIIEIKSIETLAPVHHKQLLSYLKLAEKKLGFLINFNSASLDTKSMVRIVNNL